MCSGHGLGLHTVVTNGETTITSTPAGELTDDQMRIHPERRRMLKNVLRSLQKEEYTLEIAERLIAKMMTTDPLSLPPVKDFRNKKKAG